MHRCAPVCAIGMAESAPSAQNQWGTASARAMGLTRVHRWITMDRRGTVPLRAVRESSASPHQPLCSGMRWPAHLAQASQPVKLFASQFRAQEAQAPSSAPLRRLPAERRWVLRRLPPTPFTYRADPCDVAAQAFAGSPACCCCANRDAPQGLLFSKLLSVDILPRAVLRKILGNGVTTTNETPTQPTSKGVSNDVAVPIGPGIFTSYCVAIPLEDLGAGESTRPSLNF